MFLPGSLADDRPLLYQVARLGGRWVRFAPVDVAATTWMVIRDEPCSGPPELLTAARKDALIASSRA